MTEHTAPPKDPATTAIEKGIEEASKIAHDFLGELLTPGLQEGGGLIKDQVAFWRWKNRIRIVLRAKEFLAEKGLAPRPVQAKIISSVLSEGSLEEESSMQDRWALLLAHAAHPTKVLEILPGLPHILKQLTPVEAQILDWMYYGSRKGRPESDGFELLPASANELEIRFKLAAGVYPLIAADLHRLQLIDGGRFVTTSYGGSMSSATLYQSISLTELGRALVVSCGPLPDPNDPHG